MLSHYHGQIINYSELGRSFGISDVTVSKYIEILENTFMVRVLYPWYVNLGKRLVKRPKIYIQDSGIYHTLLSVETMEQLISHNKLVASWEGFALETVVRSLGKRNEEVFFWRTHGGAEIDLYWQSAGKNWGAEFKYADAPQLTKSLLTAVSDLNLTKVWVIYPGNEAYKLASNVEVIPVKDVPAQWVY